MPGPSNQLLCFIPSIVPVDQTALRQRPAMTALTLTKSSGKSDEKTPISPFSPSAYSYSSRNPASPGLTAESPFSPGQPKSPASQQSSVNSSADFNQSLQQTSPVKAAAPPTRPSLSASQAPRRNYSTTESENSDTRPSTANTSPRALSSNYTPLTSLTMKEGWILEGTGRYHLLSFII